MYVSILYIHLNIGPLRGEAAQHLVLPDQLLHQLLVTQPILEGDEDRVLKISVQCVTSHHSHALTDLVEHAAGPLHRLLGVGRLALHKHNVHRGLGAGAGRGPDLNTYCL